MSCSPVPLQPRRFGTGFVKNYHKTINGGLLNKARENTNALDDGNGNLGQPSREHDVIVQDGIEEILLVV